MAQHRVSTRRRHCGSNVIVLVCDIFLFFSLQRVLSCVCLYRGELEPVWSSQLWDAFWPTFAIAPLWLAGRGGGCTDDGWALFTSHQWRGHPCSAHCIDEYLQLTLYDSTDWLSDRIEPLMTLDTWYTAIQQVFQKPRLLPVMSVSIRSEDNC